MSDEAHPHEIIIIKRHGGGHDDGHHGGAWKIAYADFVTAMMAFFLVMWLLSANEKTKAALVKYFNPIQLVDSTPQPPGLGDPSEKVVDPKKTAAKPAAEGGAPKPSEKAAAPKPSEKEAGSKPAEKEGAPKPAEKAPAKPSEKATGAKPSEKAAAKTSEKDDAALFKDPYAVLAEIGAKDANPPRAGIRGPNDGKDVGSGAAEAPEGLGGEAFRDPFEPQPIKPAGSIDAAAEAGLADPFVPSTNPTPSNASPPAIAPPPPEATADAAPLPAAAARAAELKSRIEAATKAAPGAGPKVEVRATPDGLLIGLTDDAKFSMFASASAEPSPRTVTLMEKIGRMLKAEKGHIVIRGYTDSRKYRSDTYDNWRLSSARADMAHYMLVRGGIDDARFDRIEGYADRQPRVAKDPEAPGNRRIEILMRDAP